MRIIYRPTGYKQHRFGAVEAQQVKPRFDLQKYPRDREYLETAWLRLTRGAA